MSNHILLLIACGLVAVDQVLKQLVLQFLAGKPSVVLIPGLLQLTYVENRGAAFGIFQGRVGLLSLVTLVVLVVLLVVLLRGGVRHPVGRWSFCLILAGGFGNLFDRVFRSFVVDYLDVSPLFSFPVFNFADCCVVCGSVLLVLYFLWFEGKEHRQAPTQEEPDGQQ